MKRVWLMLAVLLIPVVSGMAVATLALVGHGGVWMFWILVPQMAVLAFLSAALMWPWVIHRIDFDWA